MGIQKTAAVAMILASAFVTRHAAASISHVSAPTPGGMLQAAAFDSTCGCSVSPGEDISWLWTNAVGDLDEQTFGSGGGASLSSAYAADQTSVWADGSAELGAVRGAAHRDSPNAARFTGGYVNGGWNDTINVSSPTQNGQGGLLIFRTRARGSLSGAGLTGAAFISVCVWKDNAFVPVNSGFDRGNSDNIGGGAQYAQWGLATYGNSDSRTVDGVVTFAVPITIGTPFKLGVYGMVGAGQRSSGSVDGNSLSDADFSGGGLTWEGVVGVSVNGVPIGDYTIASGSGVDWTLPYSNCPVDFNHDGFVNGDDYDAYATLFESGDSGADFNHDGFVNGDDFDAFASGFEAGC